MEINKHDIMSSLKQELPGWQAQKRMAPGISAKYRELSDDYRKAGVMALVYSDTIKRDGSKLIFIERAFSSNPADKHAGQLGFPGGKYEEEDENMLSCALREVKEEIGIPPEYIEVLGSLSTLYVYASNFLVYPFLGIIRGQPKFVAQESEVNEILSVPLNRILQDEFKGNIDISLPMGVIKDVPYYDLDGKVLWGATAMITSEIESIFSSTKV